MPFAMLVHPLDSGMRYRVAAHLRRIAVYREALVAG
jgi:hypothetical protein